MKRFVKILMAMVLIGGFLLSGQWSRNAGAYTVAEYGNGGFLDIDYQVQARAAQSSIDANGDKNTTSNFYLRRDRLSFLGMANETYGYAVQLEYVGGQTVNDTLVTDRASDYDLTLLDAYLTADFGDAFKLRAGRTKHMLTREVSEGCFDPLSIDRSSFINGPFSTSVWNAKTTRDTGITALGNLFSGVFQYRLAIMQGNNNSDSIHPSNIGYRYTGRVHLSLLDPESGWGYKGSYLGKKKVLTFGAGYETEPDAVYAAYNEDTQVGTGAKTYKAYTYDVFFEYPTEVGTPTFSAAYLKQDFGNAGLNNAPGATNGGERNGYYAKAAYMLGKFQVYGRVEKWSFASLNGVIDQQINWTAEGINYYIKGQDLRLSLERQDIGFDKHQGIGSTDFNTLIFQFQARI